MTKYFFITFAFCSLLFAGNGIAAGIATSVGIPWDASPGAVRHNMSARAKVKLISQASDRVTFGGGTLAGFPIKSWAFQFKNGKLSELKVTFSVRQGRNAKGYLADQDFARLCTRLERTNGSARRERDKTFESCNWKLSNPSQTVKLYHGWKTGVARSSYMELTFRSGKRLLWFD